MASGRQKQLLDDLISEKGLDKDTVLADATEYFNRDLMDWDDPDCPKTDASCLIEFILEGGGEGA